MLNVLQTTQSNLKIVQQHLFYDLYNNHTETVISHSISNHMNRDELISFFGQRSASLMRPEMACVITRISTNGMNHPAFTP